MLVKCAGAFSISSEQYYPTYSVTMVSKLCVADENEIVNDDDIVILSFGVIISNRGRIILQFTQRR